MALESFELHCGSRSLQAPWAHAHMSSQALKRVLPARLKLLPCSAWHTLGVQTSDTQFYLNNIVAIDSSVVYLFKKHQKALIISYNLLYT